jgi:AAA domain
MGRIMPKDIQDFLDEKTPYREFTIDRVISNDGYGVVAGKTGIGKTNFLLNMAFCIAMGTPFLKLKTTKRKVLYLSFEGGEDNLKDRIMKIMLRGQPDKDWLHIERIKDSFVLLKNRQEFKNMIAPFDVVFIDPIKWFVGGKYTDPVRVTEFTSVLLPILKDSGKIAILALQVNKRDPRIKLNPGDIDSIKGAGDYNEDATFTILLERSELRGKTVQPHLKDKYITLHWCKHREDDNDTLRPIELYFDNQGCEFRVV